MWQSACSYPTLATSISINSSYSHRNHASGIFLSCDVGPSPPKDLSYLPLLISQLSHKNSATERLHKVKSKCGSTKFGDSHKAHLREVFDQHVLSLDLHVSVEESIVALVVDLHLLLDGQPLG